MRGEGGEGEGATGFLQGNMGNMANRFALGCDLVLSGRGGEANAPNDPNPKPHVLGPQSPEKGGTLRPKYSPFSYMDPSWRFMGTSLTPIISLLITYLVDLGGL